MYSASAYLRGRVYRPKNHRAGSGPFFGCKALPDPNALAENMDLTPWYRPGRGLVHFSAVKLCQTQTRWPKTWT